MLSIVHFYFIYYTVSLLIYQHTNIFLRSVNIQISYLKGFKFLLTGQSFSKYFSDMSQIALDIKHIRISG